MAELKLTHSGQSFSVVGADSNGDEEIVNLKEKIEKIKYNKFNLESDKKILQEKIESLSKEVTLESNETHDDKIDELKNKLVEIESKIYTLEDDEHKLQSKIDLVESKRVLV